MFEPEPEFAIPESGEPEIPEPESPKIRTKILRIFIPHIFCKGCRTTLKNVLMPYVHDREIDIHLYRRIATFSTSVDTDEEDIIAAIAEVGYHDAKKPARFLEPNELQNPAEYDDPPEQNKPVVDSPEGYKISTVKGMACWNEILDELNKLQAEIDASHGNVKANFENRTIEIEHQPAPLVYRELSPDHGREIVNVRKHKAKPPLGDRNLSDIVKAAIKKAGHKYGPLGPNNMQDDDGKEPDAADHNHDARALRKGQTTVPLEPERRKTKLRV